MSLGIDDYGSSFGEPCEYNSIVVILVYLSRNSRPGIQFTVHQCARFSRNKINSHAGAVKIIFHYLIGTQGQVLTSDSNNDIKLDCYVDADFSGLWKHEYGQDPVCMNSRTGYVMTLGGCIFHWVSKLQT